MILIRCYHLVSNNGIKNILLTFTKVFFEKLCHLLHEGHAWRLWRRHWRLAVDAFTISRHLQFKQKQSNYYFVFKRNIHKWRHAEFKTHKCVTEGVVGLTKPTWGPHLWITPKGMFINDVTQVGEGVGNVWHKHMS